ncbi:AAA family ATPase [Agromyces archimandritae]|uniref:ATP-binding protein n=1 Tax=Agromyces archimandritae TaxID=2781962 RepID=A0A975FIY5_9MICO|nr:ATP-binding protein [Agromyces archimandritae]QTX03348.1 ATP-binding protein [Agromyces archimandritae]
MPENPFKPSFGSTPPVLVGRDDELEDFAIGLEEGPGSPNRATIFTGARGVGKTVMLTEVASHALSAGWISADATAEAGMLEELHDQLLVKGRELLPSPSRDVTSFGAGGLSIGIAPGDRRELSWRQRMEAIIRTLNERGAGILITVDEVHSGVEELRRLAAAYQHFVRDDLDVAIAFAGLPSAVSALLNDKVLTFLRRAHRVTLEDVPLEAVERALQATITGHGRRIDPEALRAAAEATLGYPFLIQLVGFHIWRQHPARAVITHEDVVAGISAARRRLGTTVHEAGLADLSDVDRTFLVAMAQDPERSKLAAIAARMGVTAGYASQYRARLIEAGMIAPAGHGLVVFAVPYLREYLHEHAASLGLDTLKLDRPENGLV